MMAQAEAQVRTRHYIEAGRVLDGLEASGALQGRPELQARVQGLRALIEVAERQAAELYREAARAYEEGDQQKLQRLLQELEERYAHTGAYARRQ
jgi:hypothetical protein